MLQEWGSRRQSSLQHLAVADNDAQQVVEVVRDASGQPADSLHFLRHAQLALEQPFLGDVFRENFKICGAIDCGLYEPAGATRFDGRAILAFPIHLNIGEIFLVGEQVIHPLVFERVNVHVRGEVQLQQFRVRFVAQHFLQCGIDEQQFAGSLRTINAVWRVFNHGAKTDFGQAQGFRSLPSRRDVAIDDDELFRNAADVADNAGSRLQHQPRAVLAANTIFQVLTDARATRFDCSCFHALAVVRMNLIHGR